MNPNLGPFTLRELAAGLAAASGTLLCIYKGLEAYGGILGSALYGQLAIPVSVIFLWLGIVTFAATISFPARSKDLFFLVVAFASTAWVVNCWERAYGQVDILDGKAPVARIAQQSGRYSDLFVFEGDAKEVSRALRGEMEWRDAVEPWHGHMIYRGHFYELFEGHWAAGQVEETLGWVTIKVSH